MNTRALIAKAIRNGYFTSWCWTDEEPARIGNILLLHFTTVQDVEELLSFRSILGIFITPQEDKNPGIPGQYSRLQNGFYVKHDDGKDMVVSGGLNGFFHTINDMLKENIRYLYVFESGKWSFYQGEKYRL